jgi:integrase
MSASVHENRNGTVTIRIPEARGSIKKITECFPNREAAERWRSAVLAARDADRPLPDPEPYRVAPGRRPVEVLLDGFADVAWAWWKKFYPSDSVNPQRADDVASEIRLHLIPFFAPRVDHVGDITYEDCEDFVDYLSGKRATNAPQQTIVAEARELTLAEAAAWSHKSKSGIRKAWLTGKFKNGYLDTSRDVTGVVRIPIGDLIRAGYVPDENAVQTPYGYSKRQVGALLSDLRQIFKFAIAKKLLDKDPSTGIKAKDPVRGARSSGPNAKSTTPVYMFDLVTSKRIAQQLHIHHQMAFWIMRCVGLRISETYGIALEDIYRDEGEMTIRVWRQGGKKFKVADEAGKKKLVESKSTVKTAASQRVLPIARQVAELIDLYIEAFHDGETDFSTPLLRTARGSGQAGYRDALEKVTIAAHCGVQDVGYAVTPHTYRKFFATDMDDISPRARSVYMGHQVQNLDGGAAITESTYTVKRKGVAHLLVVAKTMTSLIESSIGSLVEPVTAGRLLPASACPDSVERHRALEVLDVAGLIGIAEVSGEEVIEVAQAAELLAVGERKVVRLIREGHLIRQRVDGAGRASLLGVTMSSVKERMALTQQMWSRKTLCTELNLTYHEVDYLIKVLGVVATEAPSTRGYRYTDSEVDKVRRHLEEKAAITVTAASVTEVMDELGCTQRTATQLLVMGRLEADEGATAAMRMTMVTRASLERLKTERSRRQTLPQKPPAGSIPIREAQIRTGLDRTGVLKLRQAGVIIIRTSDYQFHVEEASLDSYMK